jgi:hypothetical protein
MEIRLYNIPGPSKPKETIVYHVKESPIEQETIVYHVEESPVEQETIEIPLPERDLAPHADDLYVAMLQAKAVWEHFLAYTNRRGDAGAGASMELEALKAEMERLTEQLDAAERAYRLARHQ